MRMSEIDKTFGDFLMREDIETGNIFSGNPVEDMEIAKHLIAKHPNVNFSKLITIARDRSQPPSARIAAIYTLGFTDDNGLSRQTLVTISRDHNEPADIRDYATEAAESLSAHH